MIQRYTRPTMTNIWSDQNRYETWLKVELAACRAMESHGLIPAGTAQQIEPSARINSNRIAEIEERVRHDVIAFLTHIEEQVGEPARWLHLGMTSSDVLDTAFALQLQQVGHILKEDLRELQRVLKHRADEFKYLPMVGRTHGMHAEPITVGMVFAGYYAEMRRQQERLDRALNNLCTGKMSGAVGIYGNIPPEVESLALKELGLSPEPCATQVIPRDRHAELFNTLALLASSLERMAIQVRNWQRSEVAEAGEPFGRGQKGSSAMPHKRNPILAENLCGLARLVRSHAQAALENIPLWHERDISHSSVERVIAPDATCLIDFMLHRMTELMEGLVIYPNQIKANLDRSGGLIFSESVLLALIHRGMPRQKAYEVVQRQAMAALEGKGSFSSLLAADPAVSERMNSNELQACFNLEHHVRHIEVIYQRVFSE